MKKLIIGLLLVSVLVVSGCTQTSNTQIPAPFCNADYVKAAGITEILHDTVDKQKDFCKTICYQLFETTSYKISKVIESAGGMEFEQLICYCDVNKCGGNIVE